VKSCADSGDNATEFAASGDTHIVRFHEFMGEANLIIYITHANFLLTHCGLL
jgi:hypothetical protein